MAMNHTLGPNAAMVGGHFMRLDPQDSLSLAANGAYEPFETELLTSLIRPGHVVVDIGANIGYYTLVFARAVGPAGHVVAFEPDPDNFRLLAHNLRSNGYRNVTLVPSAVSDRAGSASLFLSAENKGDHRLYDSHDGRQSRTVSTVTVDEVLARCDGPIDLVKMDIQGAEAKALEGMRRTLERHPDASLATEFWPIGLARAGSTARDYLASLEAIGWRMLHIDERRSRVAPLDKAWLEAAVTEALGNHTNLLCVRPTEPRFANL